MSQHTGYAHCATALVNVTAAVAFDFLADPLSLGTWSLGCMRTQASRPGGPFVGFSLYNDAQVWFNIEAHRELLLVDYLVGTVGNFKPRISARVVAAETCDLEAAQCYVSLMAWRPAQMTQDQWAKLCSAHEAEIWLIKSRLEGSDSVSNR
ncbi:MAG: hypothetical protein JWN85_2241 [Gammaproteobacteria bacterium]|nr:hypothetical protein [Gammaproteobacteria bacterium]